MMLGQPVPPCAVEVATERTVLSSLLRQSRIHKQSHSYRELLDFVSRLPHIAPFNAMILHIQKPGLRFAAFERDWRMRFQRSIKDGARPLVILWPFGPVAFVYDIEDTEGEPLPADVAHVFHASGSIDSIAISKFEFRLRRFGIYVAFIEYGNGRAGSISTEVITTEIQSQNRRQRPVYRIRINAGHDSNVQFATLTHELAHLYLGHLGGDVYLDIPDRSHLNHSQREIEAESVSYLVCHRANVQTNADRYLAAYLEPEMTANSIDVYALMRAAGQIETDLGTAVKSQPL